MNLKELGMHAHKEAERLRAHYKFIDNEKFVLAQMVKLSEEHGELAEKILGQFNLQRKDKLEATQKDLPGEFADVILVTAIIAESMNIDITEAIESKLKKIHARTY